jgi:hypothetical protein
LLTTYSVASPDRISFNTALYTSVAFSTRNRKDLPRCIFRDLRELSPLHIETFYFGGLFASFINLDSSILLLIQKQNSLEYSIKIDFKELVSLIDQLFELVGDLEGFRIGGNVRIDEDGIGISVNDLEMSWVFAVQGGLTSSDKDSASSLVCVKISRPLKVVKAAKGLDENREPAKPRQPYIELAVSFRACCLMSYYSSA